MLDKSYLNTVCELKTLENELLTKGKIIKVDDTFIEISNDFGVDSIIRYEKNVKVNIHHPVNGLCVIEGVLYLPTMQFFRVIDFKTLSMKDQRNFFRVSTHLNAKCGILTKSGGVLRTHECSIHDISLGGVFIKSESIFALNQTITLSFMIDNHKIDVQGTVVRLKPIGYPQIGFGIMFDNLSSKNANIICQYLFSKHKEIAK